MLNLAAREEGVALGDVTTVGETFRGVLVLGELTVRGQAQVSMDGEILVWGGDGTSPAGSFAVAQGSSLTAAALDIHSAASIGAITGAITVDKLMCGGCE